MTIYIKFVERCQYIWWNLWIIVIFLVKSLGEYSNFVGRLRIHQEIEILWLVVAERLEVHH
ncbi:MAG: hypothetical protein AUJ56_05460 [Zetaproteobacteria bacterium CG1_02_49_23]|nr:MAG: hypothetical protein AUJ56_05460 [Zetaproteobacteria bacterium CG1_02_49_23]